MRRLLMVCYYFPPREGIASHRAERFVAHLPSFGWEATVLSPRAGDHPSTALESSATTNADVVRTASLEISRVGRRLTGVSAEPDRPAAVSGWQRSLREISRRWMYFPDAQVGWYPF